MSDMEARPEFLVGSRRRLGPSIVNRRKIILAGMWGSALFAVVLLRFGPSGDSGENMPAPRAPGAPVLEPDGERAPEESRVGQPVAAVPEGPPTMFRLDRRHTGRSPYRGPVAADVAWSFEAGHRIVSQAVVGRDGRIYVGALNGVLYCLNSRGRVEWEKNLDGPIWSTPLVGPDGTVYVGSDADVFWAINRDGSTRWRIATEADADRGAVLGPSGVLYFGAGTDLWAVDTEGAVQWRFRTRGRVFSTPAVDDDGTIYFGSQDDHFYALAPDGRVRWSYRTGDDNDSSAVIGDDGTLYFGSDDRKVYALTRDGELRWSRDLDGYIRGPVALGNGGSVIAGVYGPRPRIVSLEAATGEIRWFFPVTIADSSETGVMSGPLVDRDGFIYVGAHDDYLYSLNSNGELRWAFQANGDVDASPTLAPDGTLLFGSDDRFLYALRSVAP